MGCHTDGSICGSAGSFGGRGSGNHCATRVPSSSNAAALTIFQSYPDINSNAGNILERSRNALMYGSVLELENPRSYTSPSNAGTGNPANCGKLTLALSCGVSSGNISFDYVPNELSFAEMDSDTWFVYIWDMGPRAGNVGDLCYYIEEETRSTTGGTDPVTSLPLDDSSAGGTRCIPCTGITCTPARSYCSYSHSGPDETGDPDCPYPTVFGIGTDSNKIIFKYDQLSTELPNGCTDFNLVYSPDGIDADAWDEVTYSGDPIETTQNPWRVEDESFSTFVIYEGTDLESGNKQGLRIKVKIQPIIDDTAQNVVFTGTRWELQEVLSPGQNYAVNDTFTLNYTHTHEDLTTTTISVDLKITAVGPVQTVSSQGGFDVLGEGDTINGHTVTDTFHTDLDNFIYHVVYIDGEGSDFAKDTQYTSSRNHIITVVAGYGIADRCGLIGLYEFLDKSIQYTTHSIDSGSPDVYNTVLQPDIDVQITNGRITGLTINDGGSGWDSIPGNKDVFITPPFLATGKSAEIKATFTGGSISALEIINAGSGYSTSNPPKVWITNVYTELNTKTFEGISQEDAGVDPYYQKVRELGTFPEFTNRLEDPIVQESENLRRSAYESQSTDIVKNNTDVLLDPTRDRLIQLPQRLFRKGEVDKLRDTYDEYNFDAPEDLELSDVYRDQIKKSTDDLNQAVTQSFDNLTQENVPDYARYREVKIEAVQRRFSDLPQASTYTKYLITQYRPDTKQDASISITIGCDVEEDGDGCDPIVCPPPGASSSAAETDPTTGAVSSYTYTVSPLLGPGCQSWSAGGSMLIRHNITRAANTYSSAVEAYGNPFDI